MVGFIRRHGFLGILTLASWPNAAFDLCGLVCGSSKFPFWKFFGATLIGKGFVKVTAQTLFFVTLFRKESRDAILEWLERSLPSRLPLPSTLTGGWSGGEGGGEGPGRGEGGAVRELHIFINRSIAKYQQKASVGTLLSPALVSIADSPPASVTLRKLRCVD